MIKDYELARKLGKKALKAAKKNNEELYLPVLDLTDASKNVFREMHVGLMELPVNRIKGTKEISRRNAFAGNFMPLHGLDSEFAYKWSDLYDAVASCGIRDAIKVYEYMHKYYVQEGNKRVSVSKFYKIDFILADVVRMIPRNDGSDEVTAYYEYLDFFNVTQNYYIAFNKPGNYQKLAELLGQDLVHQWPEELLIDLKAAYFQFTKIFRAVTKCEEDFAICNAFLTYITKFSLDSLLKETDKQIKEKIKLNRNELSGIAEDSVYESEKSSDKGYGFREIINGFKRTFAENHLEFTE